MYPPKLFSELAVLFAIIWLPTGAMAGNIEIGCQGRSIDNHDRIDAMQDMIEWCSKCYYGLEPHNGASRVVGGVRAAACT
jgi:hypothetical protein